MPSSHRGRERNFAVAWSYKRHYRVFVARYKIKGFIVPYILHTGAVIRSRITWGFIMHAAAAGFHSVKVGCSGFGVLICPKSAAYKLRYGIAVWGGV